MASKDLNKVMLTGRLGADPEMRYTPGGNAVTNFRLATNRVTSSGPDGERREETEWTTIVTWSKLAEICAQYLHKGDRVYIEGRKQSRSFDGQDGQKRTVTEVVASDLIMLDGSRTGASSRSQDDELEESTIDGGYGDLPF